MENVRERGTKGGIYSPGWVLVFAYNISFAKTIGRPSSFRRHHMTFRLNAQHVLLTYAQCGDLDPFAIVSHLGSLGAECIIGRERHRVSGVHLHVFCEFERKFRSRRADVFDVGGCHPNIVPSRGTPEKGFDYATKDGDIVAGGLERPSGRGNVTLKESWASAAHCETREEFLRAIEEFDFKSLVIHWPAISKFADWRYKPVQLPYTGPSGVFDLGMYGDLTEWVDDNIYGTSGR